MKPLFSLINLLATLVILCPVSLSNPIITAFYDFNSVNLPLSRRAPPDFESEPLLRHGTPLHDAARRGDQKGVQALLQGKADVNAKDLFRDTPLHYAAYYGRRNIAELLLKSKADVNAKNSNGGTPMHWAAADGNEIMVELLLQYKADINARNLHGDTPLHSAASWGYIKAAETLLRYEADVNAENLQGETTLDIARERRDMAFIKLLEDYIALRPPRHSRLHKPKEGPPSPSTGHENAKSKNAQCWRVVKKFCEGTSARVRNSHNWKVCAAYGPALWTGLGAAGDTPAVGVNAAKGDVAAVINVASPAVAGWCNTLRELRKASNTHKNLIEARKWKKEQLGGKSTASGVASGQRAERGNSIGRNSGSRSSHWSLPDEFDEWADLVSASSSSFKAVEMAKKVAKKKKN